MIKKGSGTISTKKTATGRFFCLFLLLVDRVRTRNWIEFLKLKLLVGMLLFVLASVINMAFTNAFFVALGNQADEFVL
jgi:glucan phosphoethanolaminetransferase (alkaline phosphatase superfamily)